MSALCCLSSVSCASVNKSAHHRRLSSAPHPHPSVSTYHLPPTPTPTPTPHHQWASPLRSGHLSTPASSSTCRSASQPRHPTKMPPRTAPRRSCPLGMREMPDHAARAKARRGAVSLVSSVDVWSGAAPVRRIPVLKPLSTITSTSGSHPQSKSTNPEPSPYLES